MSYLRPNIERLHAYVPGEQPKVAGLVKLNTNENPYPPSPKVAAALRKAVGDGATLRLYPDPVSNALQVKIAALYGFKPEQVLVANGSDEVLTLALRAFVDDGQRVVYAMPSYSLYPVLADIQGAKKLELEMNPDFTLPERLFHERAPLKLVTSPNAPSGVAVPTKTLDRLCAASRGVVLIDEAYVDFADDNALRLVKKHRNALVARTLSKSYSLAGMRVGFAIGHKALIEGLMKVKDSYNVNRLSQTAALAALGDRAHFAVNVRRVKATRERLRNALRALGFDVLPSATNFLFAKPPAELTAQTFYEALRARNILVRWWSDPRVRDRVRITIGTDVETDKLLAATLSILAEVQ
ncbi:MAG: histidinol-phosphate transaminase [Verrucomicrobia bacterium]|nr:histidinol-phosphate transaminase [Verrucomicrobiota bacterium]